MLTFNWADPMTSIGASIDATQPVPVHPGIAKYLKEKGYTVAANLIPPEVRK